jgi:hypothetical protein
MTSYSSPLPDKGFYQSKQKRDLSKEKIAILDSDAEKALTDEDEDLF